jgi:transcription factor SFP1
MMGTSPLNMHQSPSFHSSSYIPKLEANFMRDFYCCQQIFPDLHALLQHYEEFHHTALQSANKAFPAPAVGPSQFSVAKASAARPLPAAGQPSAAVQASTSTAQSQAQVQRPFTQQPHTLQGASTMAQQMPRQQQQQQSQGMTHTAHAAGQKGNMAYSTLDEMATIGEMELDDPIGTMELEDVPQQQKLQQTRQMFGARPQLQINSADLAQQALRTSTPTTPAAANFGFQHNPTVSSVNTPTMTTHSQQRQAQYAQAPNVGLDGDYNAFTGSLAGQYPIAFGNGDMALDVSTIDDPAKRLFSSGGNLNAANQRKAMHQLHQLQLDPSQLPAVDPQQALLLSQMNGLMMPEEVKPFKCPVIGCEKAYKNQNGLK